MRCRTQDNIFFCSSEHHIQHNSWQEVSGCKNSQIDLNPVHPHEVQDPLSHHHKQYENTNKCQFGSILWATNSARFISIRLDDCWAHGDNICIGMVKPKGLIQTS